LKQGVGDNIIYSRRHVTGNSTKATSSVGTGFKGF